MAPGVPLPRSLLALCAAGAILAPGCRGAQGRFAYKLLRDLFANYSSALRPVEDTDRALNVTLQITLSQIIDMDERNQVLTAYLWVRQAWLDAFLTWDKDAYDGIDSVRVPSSYVWRPDIVLYNKADDQLGGSVETNVVLRSDGQIMWDSPAITKSSCKVDVSFFPFDGQQCRLTFGSWTYNGNQIDLHNRLDTGDLTDFVENVEWEVLGMPATRNVVTYGCCSEPYPDVTYTLLLRRRASFYIFNLLLPCILISFLAPLGFYLPADSGEKVSLGVTVLLALTVFQLLVAESMPPSESVPLIGESRRPPRSSSSRRGGRLGREEEEEEEAGCRPAGPGGSSAPVTAGACLAGKYYIATMTMVTASTALTIFVMNVHHCGPGAKPVPGWAKRLILHHMARVFFVREVGESCKSPRRPRGRDGEEEPRGTGTGTGTGWAEGSPGAGGPVRSCPRGRCPCLHESLLRNVGYI
uniref:Cholinergic receptor nicotinic alpha 10 subunit n=1 Tax=Dromaius novaehollandiae TaxID=8790 RepID=A0A8C4JSB6_DRONO